MDKKGQYIVKANYRHLEGDLSNTILASLIWNRCVPAPPPQGECVYLEGLVGQGVDYESLKKRGFQLASRQLSKYAHSWFKT